MRRDLSLFQMMASEQAPGRQIQKTGARSQVQKAGVRERMVGSRALACWVLTPWGLSGEFEGLASEGVQGVKSPRDGTTDVQVGDHLISIMSSPPCGQ